MLLTCLNSELILFPSITRPGLFPPIGWENPATASPDDVDEDNNDDDDYDDD